MGARGAGSEMPSSVRRCSIRPIRALSYVAPRPGELRQPPRRHGVYDRPEGLAAIGQMVLKSWRPLAVGLGRDVLGRAQELAEAVLAGEQITNHQQRPAIPDDIETIGDWTHGTAQHAGYQSLAVYNKVVRARLDCFQNEI